MRRLLSEWVGGYSGIRSDARMAGLVKLHCGVVSPAQWQVWPEARSVQKRQMLVIPPAKHRSPNTFELDYGGPKPCRAPDFYSN